MLKAALPLLTFVYFPLLFWHAMDVREAFNWHPLGMCLLFVLSAYGAKHFAKNSIKFDNASYKEKAAAAAAKGAAAAKRSQVIDGHAQRIFGALLSMIVAFAAIEYAKFTKDRPHFTSWHGQIGIATIVLFFIQWVGGAVSHNAPGVLKTVNLRSRTVWRLHRLAGKLNLSLLAVSLYMGFSTGWLSGEAARYAEFKLSLTSDLSLDAGAVFWYLGYALVGGAWIDAVGLPI